MATQQTIEVRVLGMDCTECTRHVRQAIAALPGVADVEVLLSAEKAVVQVDPIQVQLPAIYDAIEGAGYRVATPASAAEAASSVTGRVDAGQYVRRVSTLLTLVVGAVLFIVVIGEWFGLFDLLTDRLPMWVGVPFVLAGGWPIFVNVVRAAGRRQITAHTLMTLGVVAALAVGEWMTAAVVVFLMRVGNYTEQFTAESARRSVKELASLAPRTARVERNGSEIQAPVSSVAMGDIVIVRPGELIPVDGEVVAGHATVDQATITGESLPVDVGPTDQVYAATIA
jgi:P-type Cu+ transporter